MRSARGNARTVTAVGLLTMLFGAFLAFAPLAGAVQGDKVTICHRTNSVKNPYTVNTVDESAVDGQGNNDHTQHTGPVFDPDKTYTPPFNGDDWGDIIPPHDDSPGLNWDEDGQAIYYGKQGPHAESDPVVCAVPGENPGTTTVTIEKVVTPDDPGGWSFDFAGLGGDDGFTLTSGSPTSDVFVVDDGIDYTVTETVAEGFVFDKVECRETGTETAHAPEGTPTNGVTLKLAEGEDVTCTFTNAPAQQQAQTGTLQIVKAVAGNDAPTAWTFPFTGLQQTGADCPDRTTGDFCLTNGTTTTEVVTVGADSPITVTETAQTVGDKTATTTVSCTGATPSANTGTSVTVSVPAGTDVVCRFINTFTVITQGGGDPDPDSVPVEVGGNTATPPVVTPPVETPPAVTPPAVVPPVAQPTGAAPTPAVVVEPKLDVQPKAEVLDSTVTRTLPRTGDEAGAMATFGLSLLLFGAVLTIGSRRQLALQSVPPTPMVGSQSEPLASTAAVLVLGALSSLVSRRR